MKNLVNTLKQQDAATLVGLTFVGLFLMPCVGLVIYNICIGNFHSW